MATNAIADMELTDLSGNKMLVNAFDVALVRSAEAEVKRVDAGAIAKLTGINATEKKPVTQLVLKDVYVAASISGSGGGQVLSHDIRGYTVDVQESLGEVPPARGGSGGSGGGLDSGRHIHAGDGMV